MSAPSPSPSPVYRQILIAIAVMLTYAGLAWSGIQVSRGGGKIAAIWLPCAVMVAVGLNWRIPLRRLLPLCLVAHVTLLQLMGRTVSDTAGLALANAVEIGIALALARRIISNPDQIKEPRLAMRLVGSALLAAGASGLIAAATIAGNLAELPIILGQWWLAHVMAMMTIAPILLIIAAERRDARRRGEPLVTPGGVVDIVIGAGAITTIFAQTSFPLLFLAAPVILIVAARQGSPASAILLLITTVIATYFTMAGYGPINLISAGVHTRAAVLEIFVFATFASTLPVTLAHERLATLRERSNILIETMDDIPFSTDLDGRWTYLSQYWTKIFEKDRTVPLGARAFRIVPPERRKALMKAMSSLMTGDVEEAHFDFQAHVDAPAPIHLRARIRLLRKRDGSPEGFGGIITDVSRQRRSDLALAASEQRLISLAENAPVGIFQFDNQGHATFLNEAWARMHGMSVAEGLGTGWQRILDPQQLERYLSYAPERETGATTDIEVIVLRPDGTQSRMRVVTTALRDGDGKITGRMGVVVDQTREHEAKAALIAALEEAKSAATAKDRFFALMSHELRTPMNGVLGFAERLDETELTDNQRRYVSLIKRSGEIMLALLNDILDTSRMREGQMQLAREPYDLSAVVTSTCQHFEPLAARRGLALRCNFASPLPTTVIGDRQRLTQILNNLLGNALKFTERGWISVYARIEMQYERTILIVEVTDTGIGISPDARERIFEAFDQGAEDIAMRFGGTGLGLPIARGLAEQMGGSLSLVTSSLGKGSIFRLTVPLELPLDKALKRAKAARDPVLNTPTFPTRKRNVLVAEDNEINRALMIDLLADSDCNIIMVADGQEAVDAVERAIEEQQPFDLVFMDLRMPVLDGIGATKAIRALGIDASTLPIIAVTASVHQDAMDACWQAGMQDYVSKPVTRGAIELALTQWCGRNSGADKEGLTVPATPALDPELAPLLSRFIEQCTETLAGVTAALEDGREADGHQLGAVQNLAHSLAGLAATFAAPQLVGPAQALDLALDKKEPENARRALLDMQNALQSYLAEAPAV
ncbi:MAG TPA: ATP-binding protein [Sphingobium sp.]